MGHLPCLSRIHIILEVPGTTEDDGATLQPAESAGTGATNCRSFCPPAKTTILHDPETMIRQPETRPISQDQLVAEAEGIYAGLVMVESKCMEVDAAQASKPLSTLTDKQWQALIALHLTLLEEQHDFFVTSQHPSASPALRCLPGKYSMLARMWRHGIHSFLELMYQRLPDSLEPMLTFIYKSYAIMGLLDETVPHFRITWIECKGDLARYRVAIEVNDLKLRRQWTQTSMEQYSQVIDHDPQIGRLYHHLAILSRECGAVPQFFYYIKSLVVQTTFFATRESIFTLTDPIVKKEHADPFLAAVAHLVLASQSSEIRREKGHDTTKQHHIQACYRALKELLASSGATVAATCLDSEEEWDIGFTSEEIRLLVTLDSCILLRSCEFEEATSPPQTVSDETAQLVAVREESTSAPSDETDQPMHSNENEKAKPTGKAQAYTLRPSHELGILLCMLLLGIPQSNEKRSAMMAAWAPDYVKSTDRDDLAARMASGIDVYEEAEPAALLISVTITHILKRADTSDVQFWEFIHVILVFMRAMMARPDMHERFGWAFPAKLLVPFLNMALREAESRSCDWNNVSRPKFPTMRLPLNEEKKPGVYGYTAMSYCCKEKSVNMEETTFTTPLPEDKALRGLFFARQSQPSTESLAIPSSNKSSTPRDTPEAVQAAESTAVTQLDQEAVQAPESTAVTEVDQLQAEPPEEQKELEANEAQPAEEIEIEAEEARLAEEDGIDADEARLTDEGRIEAEEARLVEEGTREAEEARLQEVEDEKAMLLDRDLFPSGWFKDSKYNFEEEMIRKKSIQDEETFFYRLRRILWTATQLMQRSDGNPGFFSLKTDEDRRLHIAVPGVLSLPQPCADAKMPKVFERDGGVKVVFVNPSLIEHAAREEKYYNLLEAKNEEKRKEAEAEAAGDAAAAVDEKTNEDEEIVKNFIGEPDVAHDQSANTEQVDKVVPLTRDALDKVPLTEEAADAAKYSTASTAMGEEEMRDWVCGSELSSDDGSDGDATPSEISHNDSTSKREVGAWGVAGVWRHTIEC